jgi:hypothetical protein
MSSGIGSGGAQAARYWPDRGLEVILYENVWKKPFLFYNAMNRPDFLKGLRFGG